MSNFLFSQFFDQWSANGEPLVLVSVFDTSGSTYSKAGAMMLLTGHGRFQGMLSGGCLEGDLAERAAVVAQSGEPQVVEYDLGGADSELWGLGVGCDGQMKVFLQAIDTRSAYQPLPAILAAGHGSIPQVAVTVISTTAEDLRPGMSLVFNGTDISWSDIPAMHSAAICELALDVLRNSRSGFCRLPTAAADTFLLFSLLKPVPRVLVLGAGLDAEPVVRLLSELGWRAWVFDHRPAYIDSGDFSKAEHVECVAAASLSAHIDLNSFDGAIVMSHHLASDESYLRQLADSDISYVGLLGPRNRRTRISEKLGEKARRLEGRLHGPVGIDIHATGPAAIALSIVAELHQKLRP